MPKPEQILWYWLRNNNLKGCKFRRQYGVGNFVLDFYCPKLRLGIELDGDSHFTDQAKTYDEKREQFIKLQGIKIIRFKNTDVSQNIEAVVEEISRHIP